MINELKADERLIKFVILPAMKESKELKANINADTFRRFKNRYSNVEDQNKAIEVALEMYMQMADLNLIRVL